MPVSRRSRKPGSSSVSPEPVSPVSLPAAAALAAWLCGRAAERAIFHHAESQESLRASRAACGLASPHRREQPRPLVPAGSIAIAAGYVAVYPTDSPGGWHLLGHCSAELFNPDRDPPALLTPGTRVRFA